MMDQDEIRSRVSIPGGGARDSDRDGAAVTAKADDADYFRNRAKWHAQRAAVTTDISAGVLHRTFATLYVARADALPDTND